MNKTILQKITWFFVLLFTLAALGCEQLSGSPRLNNETNDETNNETNDETNEGTDDEIEAVLYSIAVDSTLRLGSISLNQTKAAAGTAVGVTVAPNSGYDIVNGTLSYSDSEGGNVTPIQGNDDSLEYEFIMPAANILITVQFERASNKSYSITVVQAPGGLISASAQSAKRHATITLTVVPEEGKLLKHGTFTYNDTVIPVTGAKTYSFAMPQANVTVSAEFKGYNHIAGGEQMAEIGGAGDLRLHEVYILDSDIELSAWTPIGTAEDPFTGTFTGNGHTVSIKSFSPDSAILGIFGAVKNAAISDLTIQVDNVSVSFGGSGVVSAGFAARSASNSTLRNITVGGALSIVRTTTGNASAGGVVGSAQDGSKILNCASSLDITISAAGVVSAGGIVASLGTNSVIDKSHATGDIIVTKSQGHNVSVGGLIGSARDGSTVTNSSASGTVSAVADNAGATGVEDVYMLYVGGLAGYSGQGSVIRNASATGDVYAKSPYPYAGGVVGYNYQGSLVDRSYATGNVTAESIGNLPYAGGVAGYNSNKAGSTVSTIQDCYARGNVLATTTAKNAWAGGVVGSNTNTGATLRCYATGAVRAENGDYAGDFSGQPGVSIAANAGGIAGYVYYDATPKALIKNCVALNSSITAHKTVDVTNLNVNARRVAGRKDEYGRCENNLAYVPIISAGGSAVTPEPDADGLDGADCAAQPDYTDYTALGWDFASVWKMGGDNYPVLQWQY